MLVWTGTLWFPTEATTPRKVRPNTSALRARMRFSASAARNDAQSGCAPAATPFHGQGPVCGSGAHASNEEYRPAAPPYGAARGQELWFTKHQRWQQLSPVHPWARWAQDSSSQALQLPP
mmetsp:Transcript_108235/g.186916  ORF Transcript_108235/g.186916 Transcript_108235/m.186916 type:complete len:120 (-) Transcript_108235:528-887(-)